MKKGAIKSGQGQERVAQSPPHPLSPSESELLFCGGLGDNPFFFAVLAFSAFLAERIPDCKVRGRATPAPSSNRGAEHTQRPAGRLRSDISCDSKSLEINGSSGFSVC